MTTPLTKDEVAAFVGQNADYYWTRWTPLIQGQNWTAFNWAAFLFSGLWLPYRKMYKAALIFFGIILLESILEGRAFGDETTRGLGRSVGLIAAVVCGGYGNRWYWSHASRIISKIRAQGLPENDVIEAIYNRGGTSIGAAVGFFAVFVALVFVAAFVLK